MPLRQGCLGHGQEGRGNGAVHQHALGGVAHRRAGALGVAQDAHRHIQIGIFVHIDVAHPLAGADHRHPGVGGDRADESRPPSWDEHIQIFGQIHQFRGAAPAGVRHQGQAVPGQAGGLHRVPHDGHEGGVGAVRLLPSPEDDGVARLQAQHRRVHCHVGPGLVDDANDPQGHSPPGEHQAALQGVPPGLLPHRVGQGCHLAHPLHDAGDSLLGQGQPVQQGLAQPRLPPGLQIGGVGGQHLPLPRQQGLGDGLQGPVFVRRGGHGQLPGSLAGGVSLFLDGGHTIPLLFLAWNRVPTSAPMAMS